jgi:hypothetical protein
MFSVMKKLLQLSGSAGRGKTRADIYDLHGLRAVVQPRQDLPPQQAEALAQRACYRLQQLAEALWPPLEQRSKDYIARPKPNGYRSIHLTLAASAEEQPGADAPSSSSSSSSPGAEEEDQLSSRLNSNARASSSGGGGGGYEAPLQEQQQRGWGAAAWQPGPVFVELQIRTQLMDEQAELGAAAHAGYKGGLDARQAQQLQSWTHELQRRLLQQPQQKLQLPAPSGPGLPAAAGAPGAAGCSDAELQAAQAAAEGLFRHLDRDGDGRLSLDELQLVGGPPLLLMLMLMLMLLLGVSFARAV